MIIDKKMVNETGYPNSVGILRELATEDKLEYRSFMRGTPDQFEFLLQKISHLIQRENIIMRTAILARIK